MRILAMDTASGCGSVAVADGDNLLAEIVTARRETHSKRLMSMVDQALKMAGLALTDIEGFAVTQGPGSFTGLRIGISTIKGLAVITQKPVVGISSLAALTLQASPASGFICPMLDARNREVYFAGYILDDGIPQRMIDEQSATPDVAMAGLKKPCFFIGDGAVKYRGLIAEQLGAKAVFALPFQHTIRAATIWHLSRNKFTYKQTADSASFVPTYLRQSYAELNKKTENN